MSDETPKDNENGGEPQIGGGPMEDHGGGGGGRLPLGSGRPSVSSAPGKMTFILLGAAIFLIIIIKSMFFSLEKGPGNNKPPAVSVSGGGNKIAPPLLTPPIDTVVNPPSLPPPPPPVTKLPDVPVNTSNGPSSEALRQRIRSSMIVSGGGGIGGLGNVGKKHAAVGSDPNSQFAQAAYDNTGAEQATATRIGDLNITIAQGKFIHAILETAINTDLPGSIRAIVSHDIYAEAGREVLIPKGSRLIGMYNSNTRKGQGRVFIIWTRVIRPDGVDIEIDSPGIDSLGRAGVAGDVDNKYFEMFSTAIMTSALDIGVAGIGQGLFGNQQTTTTYNGNGTSTTSSPTALAMQDAINNVGQVGQSIVGSTLNLMPTIYVDQGTPIEVFVNKDLIFPPSVTGTGKFVE